MAKKRRIFKDMKVVPITEGADLPSEFQDVQWVVDQTVVAKINEEFDNMRRVENDDIRSQIDPAKIRSVIVKDQTITTSETAIPHGLGRTPRFYYVTLKGPTQATWFESKAADDTHLYLETSLTVTADILVEG